MAPDIAIGEMPEERELNKKRDELAALEAVLAEKELELITLGIQLRNFEGRYVRIVGACYAELDEIEARIAELYARRRSDQVGAEEDAVRARTRARESAEAAGIADQAAENEKFQPSDNLKRRYRDVAKCIHPDLAIDESERTRRHGMMADANRAYREGDEQRLRDILRDWRISPPIRRRPRCWRRAGAGYSEDRAG